MRAEVLDVVTILEEFLIDDDGDIGILSSSYQRKSSGISRKEKNRITDDKINST